jgi:hypothetical protein
VLLPLGVGALTLALVFAGRVLGVPAGPWGVAVAFALPLLVCYAFHERPMRYALAVGAVLLASTQYDSVAGRPLYRGRSFFGSYRVTLDATRSFHVLLHGNTVHGMQSLSPGEAREPLTYYHRTGPIGRLFAALRGDERLRRVGLVGLGTGALACYAEPGQHWTNYEIDPLVIDVARDGRLFTFLRDCRGEVDFEVGDARLRLARTDERFGLLVVDAFSSDAIPVHLLTREALWIYQDRLAPGGLLAFNISNRYLNLQPVLAGLAAEAGLKCLAWEDRSLKDEDKQAGKSPSVWVVMGKSPADLAKVVRGGFWQELRAGPGTPLWTDDYSNLLGVFDWRGEESD